MKRQFQYSLACILFCVLTAQAQDTLSFKSEEVADSLRRINVICRYAGDSVVVRWAPMQAGDWLNLNRQGYVVRRYQLNKEGIPVEGSLYEQHVAPWTPEDFSATIDYGSDYLLAAAQCLYGAWESTREESMNMQGRYQELQNRYGIGLLSADLDLHAADALGLRYVDHTVSPKLLYLYQVIARDTALQIPSGASSVLTVPAPVSVPVIDHIAEDEGYINVKWRRDEHEDDFTAYWVESSRDGRVFSRLNDVPFVGGVSAEYPSAFFSYKHGVENYTPHYYRVIGLTAFGETSAPSAPVIGVARDRTSPDQPSNVQVKCDAVSATTILHWDRVNNTDLHGYHVLRAPRFEGEYNPVSQSIIRPDVLTFQETLPNTSAIWYYKIVAVDTAGNLNYSRIVQAAFRDTLSPDTPTGLKGTVDSNGVVRLRWNPGSEPDLKGYYVYMANHIDHYFTNMTPRPVIDTVWTDTITLRTFTEKIYYRVAAVDFHSHFSEWTEPLELSKPDTLRPFPPSFVTYRVEKDHILLTYAPSRSNDVKHYQLHRRTLPAQNWTAIDDFSMEAKLLRDYGVEPGKTYEYALTAIDDAGLSPLNPAVLRVKFVDQRRPEPPSIAIVGSSDKDITIRLTNTDEECAGYVIYRSVNNGPFATLTRVHVLDEYRDTRLQQDKLYAYKVRSVWNDGQKSDYSNAVVREIQ